jgi:hypothetical protein
MNINKSQSQTLKKVLLDARKPCFQASLSSDSNIFQPFHFAKHPNSGAIIKYQLSKKEFRILKPAFGFEFIILLTSLFCSKLRSTHLGNISSYL